MVAAVIPVTGMDPDWCVTQRRYACNVPGFAKSPCKQWQTSGFAVVFPHTWRWQHALWCVRSERHCL